MTPIPAVPILSESSGRAALRRLVRTLIAALIPALFAALLVSGPLHAAAPGRTLGADTAGAQQRKVIAGLDRVGACVALSALRSQPLDNLAFSPMGLAQTLNVIGLGSTRDVRDLIAERFGWGGFLGGGIQLDRARAALAAEAEADPAIRFAEALSIWHAPDRKPRSGFAFVMGDAFRSLDFRTPDAVSVVNDWIAQRTGGAIADMFATLDPLTVLMVVEVLHFQGRWAMPFDPEKTGKADFRLADGGVTSVAMMNRAAMPVSFYQSERLQVVSLPFGKGGLAADLILPVADATADNAGNGVADGKPADVLDLAEAVCAQQVELPEMRIQGDRRPVQVAVPRLTIDTALDMGPALEGTGLDRAIDNTGAGRAMIEPPAAIGNVQQRTVLRLDETGAEAASVTAAIGTRSGIEPVEMRLDRPFMLMIRHVETGLPVLLAVVRRPAEP